MGAQTSGLAEQQTRCRTRTSPPSHTKNVWTGDVPTRERHYRTPEPAHPQGVLGGQARALGGSDHQVPPALRRQVRGAQQAGRAIREGVPARRRRHVDGEALGQLHGEQAACSAQSGTWKIRVSD